MGGLRPAWAPVGLVQVHVDEGCVSLRSASKVDLLVWSAFQLPASSKAAVHNDLLLLHCRNLNSLCPPDGTGHHQDHPAEIPACTLVALLGAVLGAGT